MDNLLSRHLKTIHNVLFKKNTEKTLETGLFINVCRIIFFLSLTYLGWGLWKRSLVTSLVAFISMAAHYGFQVSGRNKSSVKDLVSLWVFVAISIITFLWYWLGGVGSVATFLFIMYVCCSIALLEQDKRKYFIVFFIVITLFLAATKIKGNWESLAFQSLDFLRFDFACNTIIIIAIVNFLKTEYEKEKKKADHRNIELGTLNKELKLLNKSLASNIVEKEEAIAILKKTQGELIASEKMASLGKLTAGLAHELNNPLNIIGGTVSPLKEDLRELNDNLRNKVSVDQLLHDEINMLLRDLESNAEKANKIIRNLLDICPASLNSSLHEEFDLVDLVYSLSDIFYEHDSLIKLTTPLQSAPMAGNAYEVRQALTNIVKNGIESIEGNPNGKITVSLSRQSKMWVVTVTDNGNGIEEDILPKVFEPFFSTKEPGEGIGLGLYIAYTSVKKHKGSINMYSRPGMGTVSKLQLPVLNY